MAAGVLLMVAAVAEPSAKSPESELERIDADHWKVPKDIVERGQAYDLSQGGDNLRIRTLSAIGLDRQIASDGATWLD
jgi:hypothetical protein